MEENTRKSIVTALLVIAIVNLALAVWTLSIAKTEPAKEYRKIEAQATVVE